eukprot:2202670-Prymnesium_polylepis.1
MNSGIVALLPSSSNLKANSTAADLSFDQTPRLYRLPPTCLRVWPGWRMFERGSALSADSVTSMTMSRLLVVSAFLQAIHGGHACRGSVGKRRALTLRA